MGDYGPSEAWIRDAAYERPFALLRSIPRLEGIPISTVRRYREYAVPSGRIDLLLVAPQLVVIVEFKADLADESAVAQVLRYTGHFKALAYDHLGRLIPVVAASRFTVGAQSAAFAANVVLLSAKPRVDFAFTTDIADRLPPAEQDEIDSMFLRSSEPQSGAQTLMHPALVSSHMYPIVTPSTATGADA